MKRLADEQEALSVELIQASTFIHTGVWFEHVVLD